MYEIKEEGFEYRGFKLGQMTNYGKIIGFDTECDNDNSFIATDSTIDGNGILIKDSEYITIVLNGYDDYDFSWFYKEDIKLIEEDKKYEEIIPTIQTQLNIIQQIRNVINNATVKVEFFSEEFCVSLYDSEIPICWDKQNGLYLLTEIMSGNITHDMMIEILYVMRIIESNLESPSQ